MPIRFQVDSDFYDHPKTIGMSDAAFALWVRAGSFSAAKLTDGFVAEDVLAHTLRYEVGIADELVRRGLWSRVKGGYRFRQWDERNLTRSRVEKARTDDRERKREERKSADAARKRRDRDGARSGNEDGPPLIDGADQERTRPQNVRSNPAENHGRTVVKPPPVDFADGADETGESQVEPGIVRADSSGNPSGVRPESEGIPDVSVSVSVSESVSGSGRGAAPRASPTGEPPRQCSKHLDDPDPPPCGACADQRRTHARWEAAEAQRKRDAPKCRRHRGLPADNCGLCRAEKLGAPEAS